ncbi:hypothetical protein Dimus_015431 [Dionaea muscipula]
MINIFLLGSIDKDSFIRFAVWTVVLLAYYFFIGLHASYDTAKIMDVERAARSSAKALSKVEQGEAAGSGGFYASYDASKASEEDKKDAQKFFEIEGETLNDVG